MLKFIFLCDYFLQVLRSTFKSFGLEFNPSESELFQGIPKYVSEHFRKTHSFSIRCASVKNQSDSIRDINMMDSDSFGFNSRNHLE